MNYENSKKPVVLKSVFLALLLFVLFYVAFIILSIVLSLIINLILAIPILNDLLSWFVNVANAYLPEAVSIISTVLSFFVVGLCSTKLSKNEATANLSVKIVCIALIVLNILALILNIFYKESILTNVVIILYSFAFTAHNQK